MAGAGYKLFNTGDVLLASEVNTYLMQQTVMVFANATARTSALSGVLAEGMLSYLADTNATEVYDGSAWVSVSGTGDITAVTTGANSGLAGGVTTGNADIKINFASKGQLAVGTGSGTTDFLNVGTNGHTLVADSSTSTGLKWAAASAPNFAGVQVKNGTSPTIAVNTTTTLTFDQETFDTDAFHSTSTNTSRLTCPSTALAGYYYVYCWGMWTDTAVYNAQLILQKNGNEFSRNRLYKQAGWETIYAYSVVYLANTDYVEATIWQDSAAGRNFENTGSYGSFGMYRIGA